MKQIALIAAALMAAVGLAEDKKIAVFVNNHTRIAGMEQEVAGVRDRLCAALAEVEGLQVVEPQETVGEKLNAADPNVAKMLGCDYIVQASIVNATAVRRNVGGRLATVFSMRITTKITDAAGRSVDGMPVWSQQMPVLEATGDPSDYYNMLFDRWSDDVTKALAVKAAKWRAPNAATAATVPFRVTTSIDKTIAELESQTKGVKGEQLAELRRVCGGATVELDGAVIGSAPGEFRATPGLHKLAIRREWMKPYEATVNVTDGMALDVALEMSDAGVAKWGTVEKLRADVATRYAEAAKLRDIKVNIDTANWRDVGSDASLKVVK